MMACVVPLASAAEEQNYLIKNCEIIIPSDFISSLTVSDVEGRGTINILAGTSYNGVLYSFTYRGTKCHDEWAPVSTFNTNGDIEEIVVKDADNDGKYDIIINGAKSKKQKLPDKYVFVLSMTNNNLLSRFGYDKDCGASNSVDTADLYGYTEESILFGTESKKVCAIVNWSKSKKQLLWSSDVLDNPVQYIEAADYDGDGETEIMAFTKARYEASIYLLDKDGKVLWKHAIPGGVRTDESINVWVEDLNNDGKLEILVGTQDHGLDVIGHNGDLLWNFPTTDGSKNTIVSKVQAYGYFMDGDYPVVVVGAKPYIYVLDHNGDLIWRAYVNTTVFDFDYGDLDGDGGNELVVGATSYIYVYGADGQLKGLWSYVAEIQGMTGLYSKRDMDTVKVAVYDFDNDGKYEILAAFKWFDDQLDLNVPQGSMRMFELNPDYRPPSEVTSTAATTLPGTSVTTVTHATTAVTQETTASTLPDLGGGGGGLCSCLPLLPAVLALAAAVALGLPLAVHKAR